MQNRLTHFLRNYSVGIAWTFALSALLLKAVLSYVNFQHIARTADRVTDQYENLLELEFILSALKDAETGVRGYVITGDKNYLQPYEEAQALVPTHLAQLEVLFQEDAGQLSRLRQVRDNAQNKLFELQTLIRLRTEQGLGAARERMSDHRGKAYMDAVRTTIATMRDQERTALSQRREEARGHRDNATLILISGSFVLILLAVGVFVVVHRQIAFRTAMEQKLTAANEELEQRVQHRTDALRATNESLRDEINERMRLEEQAQLFAGELQRSNKELEQFAFIASHDLQEPLRKIQAFSDRLKTRFADQLGDQGQDYLQRIVTSADRMRRLIEDLLAYSRVSTQGKPFVPVDLNQVLRDVVSDLEGRLLETRGQVEVGPLPTVHADGAQMAQLFLNLIANGLKFHKPDEPPRVHITASPSDAGDRRWQITVADHGIGFDNAYAERIFRLFERLHGRSEYEGTGMGLAICRKIVERHGGTISASSVPGAGATFTLTLPSPPNSPQE